MAIINEAQLKAILGFGDSEGATELEFIGHEIGEVKLALRLLEARRDKVRWAEMDKQDVIRAKLKKLEELEATNG